MKKTGFTLIELLAVIVILAIIALIAVPIVINIINDAKEESIKRGANLYIDTLEKAIIQENLKSKYNPDECIIQTNGNIKCTQNNNIINTSNGTDELIINMKGEKPTSGIVTIENGKVIYLKDLNINDKYFSYNLEGKIIQSKIPTAAGLYDNDYKLLATWDELVSKYGFTTETPQVSITAVSSQSGQVPSPDKYNMNLVELYLGNDDFDTNLLLCNIIKNNIELSSAKMIIVSSDITEISNAMFYNCDMLSKIIIPDSVTRISHYAFSGCSELTSITIPNSVTDIGFNAFENSGLKSIAIPSSITEIKEKTFKDCTKLNSVVIPSSVTSIGISSFWNCINLSSIKIDPENTVYEDRGSNAIIKKSNNELMLGFKNTIIPNSVTSIGYGAFAYSGLMNITIPSSVTNIEYYAFYESNKLVSVKFENSIGWCSCVKNVGKETCTSIDLSNNSTNATNLKGSYSSTNIKITEPKDPNDQAQPIGFLDIP